MPSSRQRCPSPRCPADVRSRRRVRPSPESCWMARATPKPSSSGICASRIARSYGVPSSRARRIASSPAAPSVASSTRMPAARSTSPTMRRFVALSSTINALCPTRCTAIGAAESVAGLGTATTSSGSVKKNSEPRPTSLCTPSSPPMSRTRRREIARPSPVPPYLRVVDASAWPNSSKIAARLSAGIPMPVSRTAKRTSARFPSRPAGDTDTTTSPCGVNLMALPTRFVSTCRTRVGSPRTKVGASVAMSASSSSRRSRARTASSAIVDSSRCGSSNGIDSSCRCSASILEKSRMSLIRASSVSPDVCTSVRECRCSAASSVSSSSSVSPRMAFSGVRISWLMFARKELRVWASRSAASRASRSACSAAARVASARRCSVTSSYNTKRSPSASPTAAAETCTGTRCPSRWRRSTSTDDRFALGCARLEQLRRGPVRGRHDEVVEVVADRVGRREPEQGFERCVHPQDLLLGADDRDGDGRPRQQRLEISAIAQRAALAAHALRRIAAGDSPASGACGDGTPSWRLRTSRS